MKNFLKENFGWLEMSNRPRHIEAGLFAFVVMMILQCALFSFIEGCTVVNDQCTQRLIMIACIVSDATVLAMMMTCEFVQKESGAKWDWLDILAGILCPAAVTIFTALVVLLC